MKETRKGERLSRSTAAARIAPAPIFVLVDPQMGENIGAAARAMLNFGVSGLRLVRPRDGWPNEKASAMASGASIVIDGARVFDTVDEAIADCGYVLATTARRRELSLPVIPADGAAVELRKKIDAGARCAVLFGGERNGLLSDDVANADAVLSIPVNPAFASLNLAQAALVVAYEWSKTAAAALDDPMAEEPAAERAALTGLVDLLEAALDERGYFFPEEKGPAMRRNLRAAFSRAGFTDGEVRTLFGVVKTLTRPSG